MKKGFSPQWCEWIHKVLSSRHVAIKVNDEIGASFNTEKGLWHGDPLSLILFNIVADMWQFC
jgi:hypothetical protein